MVGGNPAKEGRGLEVDARVSVFAKGALPGRPDRRVAEIRKHTRRFGDLRFMQREDLFDTEVAHRLEIFELA